MRAADMSVAAIGAVDYAKALDGLSLKQAQLMLTTQGIVGEEQKDLLVKQGLIATSDRMSASLVSEALANNGLNKEKQEELLIDLGLMNSKTKELITENAVTEAKFRAMLAEKGIKGAKADTLVASVLQTGQNTKEAISWDVLTASIKKSMIALAQNPLTWIAVAVGAVVGFIKVVDHFAITAEKLNEQLQELKATEEELISTQDKLTEIDGKIAEIQSKGTLSITDKADISRLEQEKLLLKDEIELLKLRKELQQDEYNKNAKKYADGEYSNYTHGQGDVSNLIKDYKGYKAKSERTDIDPYFVEDAKEKLKETKADLIEYRNTLNENIANLTPNDEESRMKLETIREAIEKLIYTEEELAKIKFDRFIIDPNNTGISEGFEKIKSDGEVTTQEITELASKFPTLKKFMDDNGISAEMLAAELNNVGTEAENSGGNVDKMTDLLGSDIKTLSTLQDKYNELKSAQEEYNSTGAISADTMQKLIDNDLLQYLDYSSGKLQFNTSALLNQGEAAKVAAIQSLQKAMAEDLAAVAAGRDAEASALAQTAIAGLGNNAETAGNQAQTAAGQLAGFAVAAQAAKDGAEGNLAEGVNVDEYRAKADAIIATYTSAANAIGNISIASPSGGGKSGGSGSGSNKNSAEDAAKEIADTQEKLEDLAKSEALDKIKYKFDQIEQSIEKVDNALSLLDTTLDMTADGDSVGKLEVTSRQLALAKEKASLLSNEFKELQATEYDSADSANELANRMKSVADSIAENQKSIMEYGKAITEYYTSALTSITDVSKGVLDEAVDNLDRNIKSLSEGGLMGLDFSLTPTTPESAYEAQRAENQSIEEEMQAHYNAVAEMQKIALDLSYQEQLASNAKQRAELLNTLNNSKAEISNFASGVKQTQQQTNAQTSAEQVRDDVQKETETQTFSNTEKSIINDLNTWMQNNPIVAPELDSSWEERVKEAENYAKRIQDARNTVNSSSSSSNSSSSNSSLGNSDSKIVRAASKYQGTPYVWGGSSSSGADCSGFVYLALKDAGYDVPRATADGYRSYGNEVSKEDMKPGDILFFGSGDYASHIGIYIGNNQMIHSSGGRANTASNPGKGVETRSIRSDLIEVRRFAAGTKDYTFNGEAGENFKPELLIDKKTDEITLIDKPTLIDTNKTDVVGEKTTAEILKRVPKYAKGTITVPDGLGKYYTYMNWDMITNMDTQQGKLIQAAGKNYDAEGYGKIGNRYALAMTSTFGKIGDYVDVYMADGRIIHGVLADEKSQEYVPWDTNPANKWGHDNGQSMVEFVTNWGKHENPTGNGGVLKVENLGSYFDNPDLVEDISDTASNTAETVEAIEYFDLNSELANLTNNNGDTSKDTDVQKNLLSYIKENTKLQEANTEEFRKSWENLHTANEDAKDLFAHYRDKQIESAGTHNFVPLRDSITKVATAYAKDIIDAQTDVSAENIKKTYDNGKEILDKIYDYYLEKRDKGAGADELNAIITAYSEQKKIITELSDSYASIRKTFTDYLTNLAEREMQVYQDRISWQERINTQLERQFEKAEAFTDKQSLMGDLIDSQTEMIETYEEYQAKAHAGVVALYSNSEYKPIFDQFDIESWFDAEGNSSAQYESDIATMSLSNPELVSTMQEIFSQIQVFKQNWYDAEDKKIAALENIEEYEREIVDNTIEKVLTTIDNAVEALDFRSMKDELRYDAKSSLYDFTRTLKESQLDTQVALEANKELEQWLDPETCKLLFNEDDYSEYTKGINEIYENIYKDYNKYLNDLAKLDYDEKYKEEAITAQWQRQLEVRQEELEVLKDELNIAKKTAEYNNATKERDTQIIMGNRVLNVADPEKLHQLATEKIQLENEAELNIDKQLLNDNLREMAKLNDATKTQINALNQLSDYINNLPEDMRKSFVDSLPADDFINAIAESVSGVSMRFIREGLGMLTDNIFGLDQSELGDAYNSGVDYSEVISQIDDYILRELISPDQGEKLKELYEYKRGEKSATNREFSEWLTDEMANEHSRLYGSQDREHVDWAERYDEWYLQKNHPQKALDELIAKVDEKGGFWSEAEQELKAKLFEQIEKLNTELGIPHLEIADGASVIIDGVEYESTTGLEDSYIPDKIASGELIPISLPNIPNIEVAGSINIHNLSDADWLKPMLKSAGVSTTNNYNFGDILITEPVNNANDIMNALVKQLANKAANTNNMSHN